MSDTLLVDVDTVTTVSSSIYEVQHNWKAKYQTILSLVYPQHVLNELMQLTCSELSLSLESHSIVVKSSDKGLKGICRRLQNIEHAAALQPRFYHHIEAGKVTGKAAEMHALRLVDQPGNALLKILVSVEDRNLVMRLPRMSTWAFTHDGPLTTVTVSKLPAALMCNIDHYMHRAQLLCRSAFPMMFESPRKHPQRSQVMSEEQQRTVLWIPEPSQQFDDVNAPALPSENDHHQTVEPIVEPHGSIQSDEDLMTFDDLLGDSTNPVTGSSESNLRQTALTSLPPTMIESKSLLDLLDDEHPTTTRHVLPIPSSAPTLCYQLANAHDCDWPDMIVERMAEIDVPQRRRTMRQRKGKGSKSKSASVSTFGMPRPDPRLAPLVRTPTARSNNLAAASFDRLSTRIRDTFEVSRHFRGKIQISVEIGKALLGPDCGNNKVNADMLETKMNGPSSLVPNVSTFTQMLTTSKAEMNSIVALKRMPDTWMFEANPQHKGVIELHFGSTVVEAEESVRRAFTTQTLGQTYMHYPRHVWDARFKVAGLRSVPLKAFEPLLDTMRLGAGDLQLHWKDSGQCPPVTRVLFKEKLRFRTTYQGWVMRLTHVRDLSIENNAPLHRAYAKEPSWFEMNLLPEHDFEALKLNELLKLGERAEWTEVMSRSVIESMKSLTDDLISRIDGLGADNKGPRGSEADMVEIKERERQSMKHKMAVEMQYW